jgi:hypothetical protein
MLITLSAYTRSPALEGIEAGLLRQLDEAGVALALRHRVAVPDTAVAAD